MPGSTMHATLPLLLDTDFPAVRRRRLETVQANLGYVCPLAGAEIWRGRPL